MNLIPMSELFILFITSTTEAADIPMSEHFSSQIRTQLMHFYSKN